MKIKLFASFLVLCLLLSGCNIEISFPGFGDTEIETMPATEPEEVSVRDYPTAIGSDRDKLLIPLPPDEVFNTPAEENGLDGTVFQMLGTVERISGGDDGISDLIYLRTIQGDVIIQNMVFSMEVDPSFNELGTINWSIAKTFFPMPEVGEFCCIYAEYMGFSEKYQVPYFAYGSQEFLSDVIISATDI